MTRLAGPDEADRLVYLPTGLAHADGATGKLWADLGQTAAADVLLANGSSVATSGGASIVTIDSDSKWPRLQFPADGSRTIYGSVNGGTVVPLRADLTSQMDSDAAALAIVFGG